jgi:hypothetical protein
MACVLVFFKYVSRNVTFDPTNILKGCQEKNGNFRNPTEDLNKLLFLYPWPYQDGFLPGTLEFGTSSFREPFAEASEGERAKRNTPPLIWNHG